MEEHPFIAITPWSTLTQSDVPVRVPSMGQIDLFKNYLYSIEILDAILLKIIAFRIVI